MERQALRAEVSQQKLVQQQLQNETKQAQRGLKNQKKTSQTKTTVESTVKQAPEVEDGQNEPTRPRRVPRRPKHLDGYEL